MTSHSSTERNILHHGVHGVTRSKAFFFHSSFLRVLRTPEGRLRAGKCFWILWALACISSPALAELPAPIAEALKRANIPESAIALHVQDLSQATPVLTLNEQRAMNPASVMKLLTTYAAIEVLGPAYQWKTEVYTNGAIKGEQLKGDLIFKGYGDPKITLEAFWLMLRDLRQKGLREIQGNVVLDRSYFDIPREDPGAFDNEPFKPYNAAPDALLVNFRAQRVRFLPEAEGKPPRIFFDPEIPGARILNQVRGTNGYCGDWREKLQYQIKHDSTPPSYAFSGTFSSTCDERAMNLVLQDSNAYFGGLFKQLWEQLGGTWKGSVMEGVLPDTARRIGKYDSPALSEVIRDINKFSNNVMARHLFLTLGAEVRGTPATPFKSAAAINDWLGVRGQRFLELVLDNGSGLSRTERISAQHLAWLLRAAYQSPMFAEFESSLPIVAVDGTMKKRLTLGNVSGHAHIKTGSLKEVRAIAGYVFDARGRRMAVVCVINHSNAELGRPVQDALLEWVFGRI